MIKEVIKAENIEDLKICSKLRKEVFGNEEKAPKELYIIDEYDKKDTTRNYLLKIDNTYVATVRFVEVDKNIIKL